MAASILQYLPRLLPEIQVYPLPEIIFLSTISALVVPVASLSSFQWYTIVSLILLTNTSSELRKVTAKLYGYLSFIIGVEIALINVYVLVCSWISPSTTLNPLTLAVLNVLNSVIPVYADSVILFHLVKEKASQSASRVTLVTTMGAPILLKFARLASAITYIHASVEFIVASFTAANDSIAPDFAMVDLARIQNVYISSSLQLVDNLYSLRAYWTHILGTRTRSASTSPLSLVGLVWSLGSHYVLPIILSAAQLATSSLAPSSDAGMLIDSAKVLVHVASASVATLRKRLSGPTAASPPLGKAEGLARGATASAQTLISTPEASTPQLNHQQDLSSPRG